MELLEKDLGRVAELERVQDEPGAVPESQETEADLPPEYCRYRDEGCELAQSCLRCPFPKCVYDKPGGRRKWLKTSRDREIVRLFTAEGKGVKELARRFRVSTRTVQRALGRVKHERD